MDIDTILREEYAKGTPVREIARIINRGESTTSRRARALGLLHPRSNDQRAKIGGGSTLKSKEAPMPTEAQNQALLDECQKFGIDTSAVKYFWHKSKRVSMFVVAQERPTYESVRDALIAEMQQHAPLYPVIERDAIKDNHLLVVDPADIHVGKYSVKSETGYSYDMKKAIKMAHEGVSGIVQKASGYPVDQVLLVIGNDVLHRDNAQNTTTSGTRQDVDGMWYESFTNARIMYVDIIERLMQIADVHVVFNPANHDYVSGYMLTDALACWFHNTPQVTFNASIRHRKYYQYGQNMIATTHGDGAKSMDMPLLMAQEEPKMWGNTKHRYIYQHHLHHKVKVNWQSVKDYPGITLEILRSPSAPDGWHDRNGYTGAPQAIEGFLHHKKFGQVARLTHILT